MHGFDIESWHVIAFFITIILGIFKNEIKNMVWSVLQLEEKGFSEGQEIQILSPSGAWDSVTIINYCNEIPFIKSGGVIVMHKDDNEKKYQEKFTFNNWKQLRKRSKWNYDIRGFSPNASVLK